MIRRSFIITLLVVSIILLTSITYAQTINQVADCREGVKHVEGRLLQECRDGRWVTVVTCPEGQLGDPISFTCKSYDTGSIGSIFGYPAEIVIIEIIIAIIIILFIYLIFKKFKK